MFKRILVSLLATLFFASLFGTLVGCNTIAAAGTDIQQGGKALKDEANEQKSKM
jgi:predicted small secreted protein